MENSTGMILYLAVIFMIFYFFMIRPQTKKQKERQTMLDALKKDDDVVTIGGVQGKIVGFKHSDKTVVIKVNTSMNLDIERTAVSHLRGKSEADKN